MMRFFAGISLNDYLQQRRRRVLDELQKLSDDDIRNCELAETASRYADTYRLVTPILRDQDAEWEHTHDTRSHPAAAVVSFFVPFDGHQDLFDCYPTYSNVIQVDGGFRDGRLLLRLPARSDDVEALQNIFQEYMRRFRENLDNINEMVVHFNTGLVGLVTSRLEERNQRLTQVDQFRGKLQTVFPLRRRNDGTAQVVAPLHRRQLSVELAKRTPRAAEPVLEMTQYDDILDSICRMAAGFERTPSIFKDFGEEALRMQFVIHLNALFEGVEATAETFNGAGKTDILLRYEGKNLFIAECLMWKGEQYLLGKLDDQLFKYATWNDSKLAAIVFNRKGTLRMWFGR